MKRLAASRRSCLAPWLVARRPGNAPERRGARAARRRGGGGRAASMAGAAGSGIGAGGIAPAPSWADLPAVMTPDPELGILPSREKQYDSLCATPRNDAFFKRICGGVRPNIPDLAGLLGWSGSTKIARSR